MGETAREVVESRLGVDTRALAALRVALGVAVLVDMSMRARELGVFYSDDGVLPREAQAELFAVSSYSLHAVSGSVVAQSALLVVAAAFAVAVTVGYRTRLVLGVTLVLLVSLHARNHFVLNAGDRLLRVTLLIALFLPLGARWSVDSLRRERDVTETVFSPASAVLLLHVILVYFVNFLFKLEANGLWLTGDAVVHVMRMERFTVLLGNHIADFGAVLVFANWSWLLLLAAAPVLVLTTGRLRVAVVAVYVGAHAGMFATLRLGPFPLIATAALLPFLPPVFWNGVERRLPEPNGFRRRVEESVGEARPPPRRVRRVASTAGSVVIVGFFVFTVAWQAAALGYVPTPDSVDSADGYTWSMFTLDSPPDDRWLVVPAETETGERVDAFHGGAVSYDRPPDVGASYPSTLWHRYLSSLRYADEEAREGFADYLCDSEGVETVEVVFVEQPTRSDGYGEKDTVTVHAQDC